MLEMETSEPVVNQTDVKKQQCVSKIDEFFDKYQSNPYMITKTHNYICNLLSNILENIDRDHERRMERIETMSNDQDSFIESFLNTNKYFYLSTPNSELFFLYDGAHYQICNEDDILHNVLTSINRGRSLMSWKKRTKIYIMKRIKESSLLKSIPDSPTIQYVLEQLYPTFFSSKIEAKYFLTIIGDNILKKKSDLIHIVHQKAKPFIHEINEICHSSFGFNISQTFKYKYHQHDYKNCRLLYMNDCIKSENLWVRLINETLLDLICVACHYSVRYNSSDEFIENDCNDDEIKDTVFYLKDKQPEMIIDTFIGEYLQKPAVKTNGQQIVIENHVSIARTTQISWKNMQYLWKRFLNSMNLPNIVFQQTLKTILIEKLGDFYKEEQDSFLGICSKFLPAIQIFLNFWNDTIEYDENESDFEIEELMYLFKKWCESNNNTSNLSDKQILDLIEYYSPETEIERDKYICKIRSNMWDKPYDIEIALESMKQHLLTQLYREHGGYENHECIDSPVSGRHISIYDAYNYYYKFYKSQDPNNKKIVNKSYFEKYIFDNLTDCIVNSKFISSDWLIAQ